MNVIGFGCGPWRWYKGVGEIHMKKGRVGEERKGKETDGCPTEPAPSPSQPALAEKPVTTTQSPLHPFTNVKEMSNQLPHERNFAAAPTEPVKDNEPAYHYLAPIQNPHTVVDVYNKLIQAPRVALSPEELFTISLEVCNRLCEAIMLKRVLNKTVSAHALIEQVPDDEETSITVPNVYKIVCLQEKDHTPQFCSRVAYSAVNYNGH
jgi:hypothetical protein